MMPMLKSAKHAYEATEAWRAEGEALRLIALGGAVHPALKAAQARGASPRVISTLKAAAPAVTTGSGADVAGAPASAWSGFEQALRTSSVFDAVASEAMQSQFRVRVGMLTTQLSGAKVAEGAAKLGQVLQFGAGVLTPVTQTNSVGILAERSIAFGSLRPNAFASVTSIGKPVRPLTTKRYCRPMKVNAATQTGRRTCL